MSAIPKSRIQELLDKARAQLAAEKEHRAAEAASQLSTAVAGVDTVDVGNLGITEATLATPEGREAAIDIMKDIATNVAAEEKQQAEASTEQSVLAATAHGEQLTGVAANVTLNEKQEATSIAVRAGNDVVMVGAAGTGKTTATGQITKRMMEDGVIKNLPAGTKWLLGGQPGAAVVSYTRKAVNNIRKAVDDRLKPHTLTIHKLIEFGPIYYEVEDPANPGMFKKTMRFEPKRNANNPLPPDLVFIVFEETSMISVELHQQLMEAMPHKHQKLYIGDIQQLPPIFGAAILGFKMLELPVIELTEVYRQALESPIISLAWKLLEGNPHAFSSKAVKKKRWSKALNKEVDHYTYPALEAFNKETPQGTVTIHPWQKKLSADLGCMTASKQFCAWEASGYYNPLEDIILCPFNEAFGTIMLNNDISQYLGLKRQATVHEVIAGFNKYYLAIGDRMLYDKEDAFIVDIAHNSEYLGKRTQAASIHLDRTGHYQKPLTAAEKLEAQAEDEGMNIEAIQNFMQAAVDDIEDRTAAASHIVTIRFPYSDETLELTKAAEVNNLLGGYAITVHKAQGSEWEKVFFVMHNSHATMCSRELLYTAVTRARSFLHVICEPETFEKGVKSQRIRGNTLAEKAEFFKGKYTEYQEKIAITDKEKAA